MQNIRYDFPPQKSARIKRTGYRCKYTDFNLINVCEFNYEENYRGSITFRSIDRKNYILSGIFEFFTATEGCDTIQITDDRFDVQYNP